MGPTSNDCDPIHSVKPAVGVAPAQKGKQPVYNPILIERRIAHLYRVETATDEADG